MTAALHDQNDPTPKPGFYWLHGIEWAPTRTVEEWTNWYAWFPVRTIDGRWLWRERCQKKTVHYYPAMGEDGGRTTKRYYRGLPA